MDAPEKNYETFDANGTPSPTGSLHGNANVWFYKREAGKVYILFQKRALGVHNGGSFDTTAGGHVDRGETALAAALRETREEVGISLDPSELYYLCGFNSGKSIFQIYLSDRTDKDDDFVLNPAEVESLQWVSLVDFDRFVQENAKPPLKQSFAQLALIHDFFDGNHQS